MKILLCQIIFLTAISQQVQASDGSGDVRTDVLPQASAVGSAVAPASSGDKSGTQAPGGDTQCLILVSSDYPCVGAAGNPYYKVNAGFQDTLSEANLNAGRCLERALEYANWCGDGNLIKTKAAQAYFVVKGAAMINALTMTNTQKTTLGDGIGREIRFRD